MSKLNSTHKQALLFGTLISFFLGLWTFAALMAQNHVDEQGISGFRIAITNVYFFPSVIFGSSFVSSLFSFFLWSLIFSFGMFKLFEKKAG